MSYSVKKNVIVIFNRYTQPMIDAVDNTLHLINLHAVITSGLGGAHGDNSLHYQGRALDFRTRDWPEGQQVGAVRKIKNELGPNYDVILESNHLHIEYDPKGV